jgi:hypothetical protein
MTDISMNTPAPAWPRLVGGFGLIWNLYGVYEYLTTVGILGPGGGSRPPMADTMPMWVTAAFAIAVFAGAIGSFCLLLLNRWAIGLLFLSLLADLLWDVRMASGSDHGSGLALVASVTVIGIVLAWVAHSAGKKGWLR